MKRVILLYSHQDEEWKNMVIDQVNLLGTNLTQIWNDQQIETNPNWFHELRRDLNESGAAVLLLSSDFLLSSFIRKVGIPEILEEYGKKNDLKVIPLIIRACPWRWIKWLQNYKVFTKEGKPLSILPHSERKSFLNDMVKILYRWISVNESVREILLRGSRTYFQALCGPNGRFRFLNINEIILPSIKIIKRVEPTISTDAPKKTSPTTSIIGNVTDVLTGMWRNEIYHILMVGEAGMGKTVSLIYLWKKFLEKNDIDTNPIPIFIALNEFDLVPPGKRQNFILETIERNYGKNNVPLEQIKALIEKPLKDGNDFIPSVILLMDGFNEITSDKRELLIELNHLAELYPGIQIVITSRSDVHIDYKWQYWNLVNLLELEKEKIEGYLKEKYIMVSDKERLLKLLQNPMMLTLFASADDIQKIYNGSKLCCFKKQVETAGELFWNFLEAQVANLSEKLHQDPGQIYYYKFLLKFFLPALAFEMVKAEASHFSVVQIDDCIDRICRRFGEPGFLDTFREFEEYIDILPIGPIADDIRLRKRRVELKKKLSEELHLIVNDNESFRFLHHQFPVFFASVHILNETEIAINKKEIPIVLKEHPLNSDLRQMIGEIEGEYRKKPYLVEGKGWMIDRDEGSCLYRLLNLCRGKFDRNQKELIGVAVWNILTIWIETRGELSGVDLSNLDLSRIVLNGVVCSRFYKDHYLAARFEGSLILEKNIFPMGHTNLITGIDYSKDGKKILSSSADQTIKEWDVASGQCLKTYEGILKNPKHPVDNKKPLIANQMRKTIKTSTLIPGLFIQGCSFKNLHPDSDLSPESIEILRQYGAKI